MKEEKQKHDRRIPRPVFRNGVALFHRPLRNIPVVRFQLSAVAAALTKLLKKECGP